MDNETKERQLGIALDLVLGNNFPRSLNALELNLLGLEFFDSDLQVKARAKEILMRNLLDQKAIEPFKTEKEVKETVESPGATVVDIPQGAGGKQTPLRSNVKNTS